jgi:predicted phosphodiesterase
VEARARRLASFAAVVVSLAIVPFADTQELKLPNKGQVKFAVIGDTGTASREQREVGQQMALFRQKFPFTFVITVGDNIIGADSAADFKAKFEGPYAELLSSGVKFYATLGNHDNPEQRNYGLFSMGGQRYYTFRASKGGLGKIVSGGVRFFALDSNYLDAQQLAWLEQELSSSGSDWKIAVFHHPLYSSGKTHGSSLDLRKMLEPLFVRYGVNVVFSGHDHIYERVKPQQGITYFVSGSAGSLRRGDYGRPQAFSATGFDRDFEFMLVEIDGPKMYFQAVSRTGQTIDSGVIENAKAAVEPSETPPTPAPTATPSAAPAPPPAPEVDSTPD